METRLSGCSGCLLGIAIGDAMGSVIDKKTWEESCENYGPNGLLGYDLQSDYAEITSYTQLAAFAANGLLVNAARGQGDAYLRYLTTGIREWAKSQYFLTSGERTACWLAQVPLMRRRVSMDTRMTDYLTRETLGTPENPVNTAQGPGGITAALPVGLFYDPERLTLTQVAELGASAVAMIHGAPDAFLAGGVAAVAVALMQEDPGKQPDVHFRKAIQIVRERYQDRWPEEMAALEALLEKAITLSDDPEITPLVAMTILGCTTAAECLAGSIYACCVHVGNFDEALITAVNHSGRSGAVGALTGGFMGLKMGAEELPDFYLESLEVTNILQELSKDTAQRRQFSRIFDDDWDQKYIQGMPIR